MIRLRRGSRCSNGLSWKLYPRAGISKTSRETALFDHKVPAGAHFLYSLEPEIFPIGVTNQQI